LFIKVSGYRPEYKLTVKLILKIIAMRSVLFTLTVLLVSIVAMISCSKEKTETAISVAAPTDEQLVNQVHWFMDAAKNLKEGKYLKSGEKMFLDSALYYISASLNVTYGFPEQILNHTNLDETTINLPIVGTEGKTYVVDALTGYNQARSNIKNHVLALNKPNMKTLGFIVENLGVNNTNTAITLKITTQIGYGSSFIPTAQVTTVNDWGFTEENQYWWLRNSYNCFYGDGFEGAPEVIENTLMFGYIPAPQPNCRYSYPLLYNIAFDPISYEVDLVKDNFCDYKIFYARGTMSQIMTDQVQCLGLDAAHPGVHEMGFYCNGLKEIVDGFFALPGNTNYRCQKIYIDSQSPLMFNNNPNIWYIQHSPTLSYGIRHIICDYPAISITSYVD
jgi:hypothetical protein